MSMKALTVRHMQSWFLEVMTQVIILCTAFTSPHLEQWCSFSKQFNVIYRWRLTTGSRLNGSGYKLGPVKTDKSCLLPASNKAAWTESKPLLTWEPPVCDVGCPQAQTAVSHVIPAGCSRSGPALSNGCWTEELWTDNHSWSLTTCSPITWMEIEDVSLWGKICGKII